MKGISLKLKEIVKIFFPPKRKRLELRFVTYAEADKLIRETNGEWTIAKEEDNKRLENNNKILDKPAFDKVI